MTSRLLLHFGLIAFVVSGSWCGPQTYSVDKVSPNRVYRVKVDVRVEDEESLMNGFKEWGKIQFFKGQEVIKSYEWTRKDNWEPTFIDANPVIEWVNDNVLRMGDDRSGQPFLDEVIISNETNEYLNLGVGCGKYERFDVLEVAPGSRIVLRASPGFRPDGSSNSSLGYGGETKSGKKFDGALEQPQRKSPNDGSLTFQIVVNAKTFK